MKFKTLLILSLSLLVSTGYAETKNVQHVLGGLLTRAGVKNQKPLNHQELVQLCEDGYTNAYFLYKGAPNQTVSCSRGSIHYRSGSNVDEILGNVAQGINSGDKTFVHCNNGAHASGLQAALALRQFCGISGEAAFKYWQGSLGGYPLAEPYLSAIRRRILGFAARESLKASPGQRDSLGCP